MRVGVSGLIVRQNETLTHENYLTNMVRALAGFPEVEECLVFVTPQNRGIFEAAQAPSIRLCLAPFWVGASVALRVLYEQVVLPTVAHRLGLDVLFYSSTIGSLWPREPMVVAVRYDLDNVHAPSLTLAKQLYFRILFPLSCRRAARLTAPSYEFRRTLIAHWNLPPEKVAVVYHGVDIPDDVLKSASLETEYGVRPPYILSVTNSLPHKNLRSVLETHARLQQKGWGDVQLVLVGPVEATSLEELRLEVAAQYSVANLRIKRIGAVAPKQVHCFYRHATLLLYLSSTESFSNTVVEAMAWGVPIIASAIPTHKELIGEAGELVEPYDTSKAAELCDVMLADEELRRVWSVRGRERARQFTWIASARSLLETLQAAHYTCRGR